MLDHLKSKNQSSFIIWSLSPGNAGRVFEITFLHFVEYSEVKNLFFAEENRLIIIVKEKQNKKTNNKKQI